MDLALGHIFGNHQQEIKVITEEGGYDNRGIYTETEETLNYINAIVRPLSTKDLIHDENGTYTNNDIKVFTKDKLNIKNIIEYNDLKYTILEEKNNKFHGDFYSYIAKCEDGA